MTRTDSHSRTRQRLLRAALRHFAHSGYAAAAVQHIVDDARVSKPALYYHFKDKAGLFQALVDEAHDQRYRLMQSAVARRKDLEGRMVEILVSSFDFLRRNRELMRIAFATAFASAGEMPKGLKYSDKCERNFEFIHELMKSARAAGVLDKRFDSEELAFSFYGLLSAHLATQLVVPECRLYRRGAGRIVKLFLTGAAARKRTG